MRTATQPQVVATVISVTGMAFARNADGAVRRLALGDVILVGEIVFTLAASGRGNHNSMPSARMRSITSRQRDSRAVA